MVNDTYRSYRQKIPNQSFRNFFINGKQPLSQVYGNGKRQLVVRDQISPLHVVYCSFIRFQKYQQFLFRFVHWNRFGLFYLFISIEILNLNLTFAVCRKRNPKSLQYLKLP